MSRASRIDVTGTPPELLITEDPLALLYMYMYMYMYMYNLGPSQYTLFFVLVVCTFLYHSVWSCVQYTYTCIRMPAPFVTILCTDDVAVWKRLFLIFGPVKQRFG